jgi:dihydroxyacid dehydratase/phosphogluconate dehydratase
MPTFTAPGCAGGSPATPSPRPHLAVTNTASDLTPCTAHLDEVAASVKNGTWESGASRSTFAYRDSLSCLI